MLNHYIQEYKMIKVSYAMAETDPTRDLTGFFNKVYDSIEDKNNRRKLIVEVDDSLGATTMFFDMFLLNIGNDLPISLTYYFATLTILDESLSHEERNMGSFYRAAIMVKASRQLNFTMNMICNAGHEFRIYRGHLDNTNFVDIAILYDVYRAWNVDSEIRYLQFLKNQAPSIARKHSYMTDQTIETEGVLAHEAIFKVISERCN